MSGHSHYSSIKYKKAITDKKRGKIFSKLTREISVAARQGGDVVSNSKLRWAIEKAKAANMPKANIEKAIKKGAGELTGEALEEFLFEAYGPKNTAIIIEGITDNKNRSLAEIKQILNQNGGKLVGEGSVRWKFKKRGVITVVPEEGDKEELELKTIEAGAEDISWHKDILDVYTKIEELDKVKKNLEEKGIKVESASLEWVAKEQVILEEKEKLACEKLFEALDESDSVQEIYSNLNL